MAETTQEPSSRTGNGGGDDQGIHLVIIGAGLAGLAAALSTKLANPAHKVTICEAVRELQEVGAGLQVTPNGTRLLAHWRLASELAPLAAVPSTLSVHRYDGTKLLAHEPDLQAKMLARYGSPFWDLHRVDLQKAMVRKCLSLGVTILLDSRAVSVDFSSATATLHSGHAVQGDVVLLADGLWSSIRPQALGRPSPAVLTGDLAYRITLHTDDLSPNSPEREELARWIAKPTVHFWAGPKSHAVGYSVRAGTVYNIVLLCPDDLPDSITKSEADLPALRTLFSSWDPVLQKFLSQVRSVHKWKLMWLDALPEWANSSGTFFMAGDCCHPMLPYLAQGVNSSLEDGAVLGHLLSKVSKSKRADQLPRVAELYQRLRMERGRKIQLEGFRQRDDFHMEDGEAQQKRDKLMTSMIDTEPVAPFPSRWTCPDIQSFLYGYDAYAEAEAAYRANPF
ncbi:hypothetical protein B0H66DRAFT_135178 [Apodospora peruviana]|uniref:FAD-binding domain-containing protein n=1 Tax=Apodospora peruviana TaxID=516989 RepID=A0AAE0IIQ7_9PEZI|nr:hypothetical protein B0H66DRAFT_135178 [Apodospora peruviana]